MYERPAEGLRRYMLGTGDYPYTCRLKTPTGLVEVTAYHPHDMQTVNEVFCRVDYAAPDDLRVAVDIGSNIGVSALYFLTRNRGSYCYLYEPDPRNLVRLRRNLEGYERRYLLSDHAVSDIDAVVKFGLEPTGRYGRIGAETSEAIDVRCENINGVLETVLENTDEIDILKIDIEGDEERAFNAIRSELLERVCVVYLETGSHFDVNVALWEQTRRGPIVRIKRIGLSDRN